MNKEENYKFGWVSKQVNSNFENWCVDVQYGTEKEMDKYYKETYEEEHELNDFWYDIDEDSPK